MNNKDVKNISNLIEYRETLDKYKKLIDAGPDHDDSGEISSTELSEKTTEELKTLLNDFKNNQKSKVVQEFKNKVDEMFKLFGEEGDNMIVLSAAYVPERTTYDVDDPFGDIYFSDDEYNKLYKPICRDWDCRGYWNRKDKSKEELEQWDKKWDEYYNESNKLIKLSNKIKIDTAAEYWEDDNDALNECWYGVIGVMKDYRIVAFVIRNDGLLCDEEGYDTFHNSILETL